MRVIESHQFFDATRLENSLQALSRAMSITDLNSTLQYSEAAENGKKNNNITFDLGERERRYSVVKNGILFLFFFIKR